MTTSKLFARFALPLMALATALPTTGHAAQLSLSQTPLFLSSSVAPNVIMTLDDSGSMCWAYTPGASSYDSTNRGPFTTPAVVPNYGNGLYYNPRVAYSIPVRTDKPSNYYSTSFTSACLDGFSCANSTNNLGTVNLSNSYYPTKSYCNDGAGTVSTSTGSVYTCTAAFGMQSKTCKATFAQSNSSSSQVLSCSQTDFVRQSYSSSCDVSFSTTKKGYNEISASNCGTSSPFQGLSPGSYVTINNHQYTLANNQPKNNNNYSKIYVTNSLPQSPNGSVKVSWNLGNDYIKCNSNSTIFNGLTPGSTITVSGNNNNGGTYTVADSTTNTGDTIVITSAVKQPENGAQARFSFSTGGGSYGNTITVSNCGNNPFSGLSAGDQVTVSGSTSNNRTFTLTQAPSNSNKTLTVQQSVTGETANNVLFGWPAAAGTTQANSVTVTNCFDQNGDPNNSPFGSLSRNDSVTIGSAGTNSNAYTLSSSPSNNDSTLTLSPGFSTQGIFQNVTFSFSTTTSTGGGGGGGGNSTTTCLHSTNGAACYDLYYADLASVSGTTGATLPSGCNPDSRSDSACYVTVTVGSANDLAYSGWSSATLSQQNFANWYSFYRTRALSVMTGAVDAVSSFQDNEVRLAWQTINNCKTFSKCLNYDNSMHPLTTAHRADFYNWLEHFVPSGSTPLRSAMKRAGDYYMTKGSSGPYVKDPGVDSSAYSFDGTTTELSCRKDFQVMFTDGYWNSDSGFSIGGNVDNASATLPDGNKFTPPMSPYSDSNSDDLSDIAFYYWAHDLRSDLADNVPAYYVDKSMTDNYWNPKNDPATWQHMTNFTIGLGLSSDLGSDWGGSSYSGAYNDFLYGNKSWPADGSNSANNVYDLWHAALNSRGQFFSADTADGIANAFKDIVGAIRTATPSSAAVAANSTSIQTSTLVYQATFDSSDWSGHLKAIQVLSSGAIGSTIWDAASMIPAFGSRKIFTISTAGSPAQGTTFDATGCSSLSTSQQSALNSCDANLINYLRGDGSHEIRNSSATPATGYRNRTTTVLGDIINSDPAYVYNQDFGYATAANLSTAEKSGYSTFLANKIASGKHPMVYVGSNDGMLHAFNAEYDTTNGGGFEVFAYVPAGVYSSLANLSNTTFSHNYMVDGAPTVGDAYVGGTWRTYLVGGLNSGGQSIYALDITNPETFSATNVKWEYTDTGLGYTYSRPEIARLTNGTWVAIFGNGYNSAPGHASLYVVDLASGNLVQKLDTSSLDTNQTADNGLSSPALYINNGVVETAYAGDLHGNLWKFDLSNTDPTAWPSGITRLFAATNSSGQVQPITAQPAVGPNSSGGNMVYFGTGQYLTATDPTDKTVQSFYAVWDKPGVTNSTTTPSVSRSNLQQQYIYIDSSLTNTTQYGYYTRVTTANPVDYTTKWGWYMDLLPYTASGTPPSYSAGTPLGERVRSVPLLKYNRVVFVTLIPSIDPCVPGGQSWLMELNALDGNQTTVSSFDFNNDNKFDSSDKLSDGSVASGIMLSGVGIATTPTWLEKTATAATKVITGSSGTTVSIANKGGSGATAQRIYWQQIQ